jgi:hypothetical protein
MPNVSLVGTDKASQTRNHKLHIQGLERARIHLNIGGITPNYKSFVEYYNHAGRGLFGKTILARERIKTRWNPLL